MPFPTPREIWDAAVRRTGHSSPVTHELYLKVREIEPDIRHLRTKLEELLRAEGSRIEKEMPLVFKDLTTLYNAARAAEGDILRGM